MQSILMSYLVLATCWCYHPLLGEREYRVSCIVTTNHYTWIAKLGVLMYVLLYLKEPVINIPRGNYRCNCGLFVVGYTPHIIH